MSEQALGLPWTGCPQRASNAFRHENRRVPSGSSKNGRLIRQKARPYSRYEHCFFPFIRQFSSRARLAGLMSLDPSQKIGLSQAVRAGQAIGKAQDLSKVYPRRMTNHVHIDVKKDGEFIDPTEKITKW